MAFFLACVNTRNSPEIELLAKDEAPFLDTITDKRIVQFIRQKEEEIFITDTTKKVINFSHTYLLLAGDTKDKLLARSLHNFDYDIVLGDRNKVTGIFENAYLRFNNSSFGKTKCSNSNFNVLIRSDLQYLSNIDDSDSSYLCFMISASVLLKLDGSPKAFYRTDEICIEVINCFMAYNLISGELRYFDEYDKKLGKVLSFENKYFQMKLLSPYS